LSSAAAGGGPLERRVGRRITPRTNLGSAEK